MTVLGRRSFLGMLGAAPVAAKGAAEAVLVGIRTDGLSGLTPFPPSVGPVNPAPMATEPWYKTVIRIVRGQGLPEWALQERWEQARYVTALDPDIACKRSWSMSVKILEQRQRNYKRALADIEKQALLTEAKQLFCDKYGYWL